jgi:predicted metal-binding membrane protein
MTVAEHRATAAVPTATLGVAGASWVVAVGRMDGMDMGVATDLGSFAFFVAAWVPMMAAMMLPGAVRAVSSCARAEGRVRAAVFAASYLAVWTVVGLMVMLLALGVMSVTWMSVVAVVVLAQKLMPPIPTVDVALTLAILALGIVVFAAPSSIPGLIPPM